MTPTSKSRLLPWTLVLFAALAFVALESGVATACPSCKAALANQDGKGDLVSGFMYSILFMLSMPFAIFGSFSGYFYMLVRRARRQQEAQQVGGQSPDQHAGR